METLYVLMSDKCNKDCEYCENSNLDIPYKENPRQLKELSKIFEQCNILGVQVLLGGGEPGLISQAEMDNIMQTLSKCSIATNGTFVDRGYYARYKDKIQSVIYHILNPSDVVSKQVDEFKYVYIVHNQNLDTVKHVLHRFGNNIQLKFYNSRNVKDDPLLLTTEGLKNLYDTCMAYNYRFDFLKEIHTYINRDMFNLRKMRSTCLNEILPSPGLNLYANRITPCCRADYKANDEYPLLTYYNYIDYVYINHPRKYGPILEDINCQGCNRYNSTENIYDEPGVQAHIKNRVGVISGQQIT